MMWAAHARPDLVAPVRRLARRILGAGTLQTYYCGNEPRVRNLSSCLDPTQANGLWMSFSPGRFVVIGFFDHSCGIPPIPGMVEVTSSDVLYVLERGYVRSPIMWFVRAWTVYPPTWRIDTVGELIFTVGWALKEALCHATEASAELRVGLVTLRGAFAAWRGILFGMRQGMMPYARSVPITAGVRSRGFVSTGTVISVPGAPRFVRLSVVTVAPSPVSRECIA